VTTQVSHDAFLNPLCLESTYHARTANQLKPLIKRMGGQHPAQPVTGTDTAATDTAINPYITDPNAAFSLDFQALAFLAV
jgi:hypothetical protein